MVYNIRNSIAIHSTIVSDARGHGTQYNSYGMPDMFTLLGKLCVASVVHSVLYTAFTMQHALHYMTGGVHSILYYNNMVLVWYDIGIGIGMVCCGIA